MSDLWSVMAHAVPDLAQEGSSYEIAAGLYRNVQTFQPKDSLNRDRE